MSGVLSTAVKVNEVMNEPIFFDLFDSPIELFLVTLPFTADKLPKFLIKALIWLPVVHWITKKIFVKFGKSWLISDQDEEVDEETYGEIADLLNVKQQPDEADHDRDEADDEEYDGDDE